MLSNPNKPTRSCHSPIKPISKALKLLLTKVFVRHLHLVVLSLFIKSVDVTVSVNLPCDTTTTMMAKTRGLKFPLLVLLLVSSIKQLRADCDDSTNNLVNATTAEIIELRGFKAITHHFCTSDGYQLELVEGRHPDLDIENNHKYPVLFIHGVYSNANYFIANSIGAHPQKLTNRTACDMSLDELQELLADNPNSHSLPFTLMDWNTRVFFMNRRGSVPATRVRCNPKQGRSEEPVQCDQSVFSWLQQVVKEQAMKLFNDIWSLNGCGTCVGGEKVDRSFWNYSLDEQVDRDMPESMVKVLNITGKPKLSLVSHSIGSALVLMTLAHRPSLSKLVHKALVMAPSLDLEYEASGPYQEVTQPIIRAYIGPMPPISVATVKRNSLVESCQTTFTQDVVCAPYTNGKHGDVALQNKNVSIREPLLIHHPHQVSLVTQKRDQYPGFISQMEYSSSSHEIVSRTQSVLRGCMFYYDYRNKTRNEIAYGQPHAPPYNISLIDLDDMQIWFGQDDTTVPPRGMEILKKEGLPGKFRVQLNDTSRIATD